jgi:hypothetical protein
MGSLGTQQLRSRQIRHPTRTDAGVGLDIFPGTAISVFLVKYRVSISVCMSAAGWDGNAHVEKVEPSTVHVDQDVVWAWLPDGLWSIMGELYFGWMSILRDDECSHGRSSC